MRYTPAIAHLDILKFSRAARHPSPFEWKTNFKWSADERSEMWGEWEIDFSDSLSLVLSSFSLSISPTYDRSSLAPYFSQLALIFSLRNNIPLSGYAHSRCAREKSFFFAASPQYFLRRKHKICTLNWLLYRENQQTSGSCHSSPLFSSCTLCRGTKKEESSTKPESGLPRNWFLMPFSRG